MFSEAAPISILYKKIQLDLFWLRANLADCSLNTNDCQFRVVIMDKLDRERAERKKL